MGTGIFSKLNIFVHRLKWVGEVTIDAKSNRYALPGWQYIDGIWTGPFPIPVPPPAIRMCANCGTEIAECMGCVKADDILPALKGEPLIRFPRELCFICATTRCYWGGPDGQTLVKTNQQAFKKVGEYDE